MAAGTHGVTHYSGLSVGVNPSAGDSAPTDRATGAWLSVGTYSEVVVSQNSVQLAANASGQVTIGAAGSAIADVIVSTQSVDAGGVTASRLTTVNLLVTGTDQNAFVHANPYSQWSGVACHVVSYQAYAPSNHSVAIVFSNDSGNDATIPTVNWRVLVINPA